MGEVLDSGSDQLPGRTYSILPVQHNWRSTDWESVLTASRRSTVSVSPVHRYDIRDKQRASHDSPRQPVRHIEPSIRCSVYEQASSHDPAPNWLAPSTKPEESDTNIFRWTSSLLAVIKHATKLSHLGADLSSLKICIADTRMFPRGQFAPGKWVIDSCDPINTSELSPQSPQSPTTSFRRSYAANEAREYLRFYLGNGEGGEDYFMSQGKLHIADRSSTVSLEDLIDAGLYQLYPELDPVNGSTMSLTDLRSRWSQVSVPRQREKNLAAALGRRLVQGSNLDAPSATLMFLYFKNREQARPPFNNPCKECQGEEPVSW